MYQVFVEHPVHTVFNLKLGNKIINIKKLPTSVNDSSSTPENVIPVVRNT